MPAYYLCIGEHTASGPELGRIRRCSRAELYRTLGSDGAAVSWGARLFNGRDEQIDDRPAAQPLPHRPPGDPRDPRLHPPRRLAAWDALRARFLDLPEDPLDRSGKGFRHSG
ncbi:MULTISPECIES: hypothetical protein [unclassified Streptomyces]|uniref:DUF7676 family protein n=1 Tax=unclassified Streptomyces TaxID=2593676 RepID=UPI003432A328